ncbi:MAG: hypothetical protein ABIQ18_07865 [Umezawaea sp.]
MSFRLLRAAGIALGSSVVALLGTSTASAQVVDSVQPETHNASNADAPPWRAQLQARHRLGSPRPAAHQIALRLALGHSGVVIDSREGLSVLDYTARTPSLWQAPLRGLLR